MSRNTNTTSSAKRTQSSGFQFGTIECRYFPKLTHPVLDMELVYINKGEGLCFTGDGIMPFHTGELFFFSSNTPHYFQSAHQFYQPNYPLRCGATYLRFSDGILPMHYQTLPDCSHMKQLVESAKRGVKWDASLISESLIKEIETMEEVQGFDRFIRLLHILNELGDIVDNGIHISSEYKPATRQGADRAYNILIEYISNNFRNNITLDELAAHTDMNRTALCRHFRARSGRSIFDYLLSFRVKYAMHLLETTHLPIAEIALDSGFNNLPNFNVQFKRITGYTPTNYRIRSVIK